MPNEQQPEPPKGGTGEGPDADLSMLETFSARLGLEGEDKDKFIKSSMTRFGYKPKTMWEPPAPEEPEQDDSDFFGGRGKKREERKVGGQPPPQQEQQGGSSGWQY